MVGCVRTLARGKIRKSASIIVCTLLSPTALLLLFLEGTPIFIMPSISVQNGIVGVLLSKLPSGQQILRFTVSSINTPREKGIDPNFHWVPAHKEIMGNELADVAAKEATGCRKVKREMINFARYTPTTPPVKSLCPF